tara:strand:- start:5537 stop:6667 length:1131 start_codon:yes stop_codon:yes gene_type:complete
MKKILVVFGTRPEAIKMAPVIQKLKKEEDCYETRVCVTAQHREMLDQVLELFKINPDYDLNIMQPDQNLDEVASKILIKLKSVLDDFLPDLVLVHGDTITTFAASFSAYLKKIKVGHVEAGLRTGDLFSPWPEEGNRRLTSILTDYHFAPTALSKKNLLDEGIDESKIFITGNSVIDALQIIVSRIKNDKKLKSQIEKRVEKSGFVNLSSKFILVTGHRRENFGQGMLNICKSLKVLAENNLGINFLYPVHLNPNVRKPVNDLLSDISNIKIVEPFEYEEFVYLMSRSYLILTDSGGIQEEAPSLGKPVLVMRDKTERPEAIEAGTVKLVGSDKDNIVKEVQRLLDNYEEYQKMCKAINPYGDGKTSERIIEILKD